MMRMISSDMKRIVTSESGATAVEYAVIVSLIIIVAMAAISAFGTALTGWFNGAAPTVSGLPTS